MRNNLMISSMGVKPNIIPRHPEDGLRLSFVAPRIVEAICHGRQPADLSAETLLNRIDLPLEWSAQLNALGIDWSRGSRISARRWMKSSPTVKRTVFSPGEENTLGIRRICSEIAFSGSRRAQKP